MCCFMMYSPRREKCSPRRCARCRTGRAGHSVCGSRGIDSDTRADRRLN
jgi:hypothetical protein